MRENHAWEGFVSNCDLSIDLGEASEQIKGGQTVRGSVVVNVGADVRCSGLEVQTRWETHGYGNVQSGVIETKNLFEGQWEADQTYRYDFELTVAAWPPTYHGELLNIDHLIEARARIPWSFDPKVSRHIQVTAVDGPEAFKKEEMTRVGCAWSAGCGVFFFVMISFAAGLLLVNPLVWMIGGAIGAVAAGYWIFTRFLPRYLLGQVDYKLLTERLAPGGELRGELRLRPKRPVRLNRIVWTVSAEEVCTSGSGSNRSTKRHDLFRQEVEVLGATKLMPEQNCQFPLLLRLPEQPYYSIGLTDNHLTWTAGLRVDIPRWPDLVESLVFQVLPQTALVTERSVTDMHPAGKEDPKPTFDSPHAAPNGQSGASLPPIVEGGSDQSSSAGGVTFAETVRFLWQARGDRQQTDLLTQAVEGLCFDIDLVYERRAAFYGDDPAGYPGGLTVWGSYPNPELALLLHVPAELEDQLPAFGGSRWTGRGTVVGYDHSLGRLVIRIEAPAET